MARPVLLLVLLTALLLPFRAAANPAVPSGTIVGPGPRVGTSAATVDAGADVQVRDLFTAMHGDETMGEVLVLEVAEGRVVIVPTASFRGRLQPGDRIVFKERLPAPVAPPPASATPTPTPVPSGPLNAEKAEHVVNPLPAYSGINRAELHGTVVVRNLGRRPASGVKLTVTDTEQTLEFPLGTIAPGQSASAEWSLQRVFDQTPVQLQIDAVIDGKPLKMKLMSTERIPPDPHQGERPPGY